LRTVAECYRQVLRVSDFRLGFFFWLFAWLPYIDNDNTVTVPNNCSSRVMSYRYPNLRRINTPEEEEEERAAECLALNGVTMEPEPELFPQLRAASSMTTKKKPTVRVNRFQKQKQESLVDQILEQRQQRQAAKLKAAAAASPVQITATIPTHDIPKHIMQSLRPDKTHLIAKTSCLGCGEKATQILQFTPSHEIRPTANPKILRGYCQACKGDLYAQYSGSAL